MQKFALPVFSLLSLAPLGAQEKPISTVLQIGDLTAPLSHELWIPPVQLWMLPPYSGKMPRLWRLGFQENAWDDSEGEEVEKPRPFPEFLDGRTILYLLSATGATTAGRASFSLKGQELGFTGSHAALTRARSWIQDLRSRIAAPISVEIAVYRESGAAAPGVNWLTPADAEKRMQRFRRGDRPGILFHEQARIRPGDRIYLGERRSRIYLSNYNAEISATLKSVDPKRSLLRYGHGMSLIFESRPDGQGLALHFEISLLEAPDKVDLIKVGTTDIDSMERVRHSERRLMGSLSMPNEAAFLYVPGGSRDTHLRALVLVHRKVTPPPVETGVLLLPNSWLMGKLSRNHAPLLTGRPRLSQPLSQVQLRTTLLESVGGDKDGKLSLPVMNERYLILEAKPAVLTRALAALGKLSSARSRNFLVRLGCEAWLDGKWTEQGIPLALPVMANRSAAVIQGKGMSYVAGYFLDEEEEVRILTPELGILFVGRVAQISVTQIRDKLAVRLDLEETKLLELRRIERTGRDKSIIEAPKQSRLVRSLQLELKPREKRILGSGMDIEVGGKKIKTRLWIQVEAPEVSR